MHKLYKNERNRALGYCNEVLQPVVLSFMQRYLPQGIFQHNNMQPHTDRFTTNFLHINHVNVIDWPSLSPFLGPNEYLWDKLGHQCMYANDPQLT